MTSYNWKMIFESKSVTELLEIYKGNSSLSLESEILAGSVLIDKGYDKLKLLSIAESKSRHLRDAYMEASNPNKIKDYLTFYEQLFWVVLVILCSLEFILIIKNLVTPNLKEDLIFLIGLPIILIIGFIERKIRFHKYRSEIIKDISHLKQLADLLDIEIITRLKNIS